MIRLLTEENAFHTLTSNRDSMVLVDFYADWCEPCKWLDQILVNIAPALSDNLTILKVDVEQFPGLRQQYEIRGIPVLVLFKSGHEVWRMNGFLAENELIAKIESFI